MNILITGTQGLARSLSNAYIDHSVTMVSFSGGYDINNIDQWGSDFLASDCIINCAYDKFAQVKVLEFFFKHWENDPSKKIISIGSRVITHKRLDNNLGYWDYRLHKQTLQQAHDAMLLTAKCDLKIINPGPIDTAMVAHQQCVKYNPDELAIKIKNLIQDPTIKRVDLWL
jgi:hypothetical protein